MSTHWDVTNAVSRFFTAIDAQDWDGVADRMTDPIHTDYESFGAGPPASQPPRDVIAGWKGIVPGFEHTHHQLGNYNVEVDNDRASVSCYVTASHVLGERCWTVVGRYEMALVRQGGAWRLSSLRLLYRFQSGQELLPVAMERTASLQG